MSYHKIEWYKFSFLSLLQLDELFFFLLILLVFIFSYGISSQALIYHGEASFNFNLTNIFFIPYWQMYGELMLEELQGEPKIQQIYFWIRFFSTMVALGYKFNFTNYVSFKWGFKNNRKYQHLSLTLLSE